MTDTESNWWIYRGTGKKVEDISLPPPPPWRQFNDRAKYDRSTAFVPSNLEIELVNTALYLRRPLLVTGKPGTGKSSLAYAVAHELGLGAVLEWPITTRSTLQEALYRYDAIARLQDASLQQFRANNQTNKTSDTQEIMDIGRYIRLGPLGTAFLSSQKPRVLLIDEIDKSDIDLPNDLLHIFEGGEFQITELARLPEEPAFEHINVWTYDGIKTPIQRGRIVCNEFPLVILTSNGEREFPPAFLRRCLRLEIQPPDEHKLRQIVASRLKLDDQEMNQLMLLIYEFLERRDDRSQELATDQLLNAIYLTLSGIDPMQRGKAQLLSAVFRSLTSI